MNTETNQQNAKKEIKTNNVYFDMMTREALGI